MNEINPTAAMVKGIMAQHNEERKESAQNMRLGQLIKALEAVEDKSKHVQTLGGGSLGEFESYRGYYEDLSIEPTISCYDCTVETLEKRAKEARGKVFTGYKGGDFPMHDDSIIWISAHGTASGIALTSIEELDYEVIIHAQKVD